MTKTFTCYHHRIDQEYKEKFVNWATASGLITDYSVGVGEIDENLEPQVIRRIIRDRYLRDSEVTVLLCGLETRYRKHVDWELKSSMIDGNVNRRSGIVVIDLPSSESTSWHTAFPDEKKAIYADYEGTWTTISTKAEYELRYPNIPGRIIENLLKDGVKIPVVPWDRIYGYPERLSYLLTQAAIVGRNNSYDLSRKMRMRDHNPITETLDIRV